MLDEIFITGEAAAILYNSMWMKSRQHCFTMCQTLWFEELDALTRNGPSIPQKNTPASCLPHHIVNYFRTIPVPIYLLYILFPHSATKQKSVCALPTKPAAQHLLFSVTVFLGFQIILHAALSYAFTKPLINLFLPCHKRLTHRCCTLFSY